jgi:hypothetical protein
MSSPTSVRDLLRGLAAQGHFEEVRMESAGLALAPAERPLPVYLQALVGAGAWLAAICFLAFLALARIIDEKSLWPAGLVLLAFATALRARFRHVFLTQAALALALAGQGLAIAGIGETSDSFGTAVIASAVMAAGLYPLYRDPVHRFLSPGLAIALAVAWCGMERVHGALHAVVLVSAAGALFLWTRPRQSEAMRPLAYAFAAAVPGAIALLSVPEWPTPGWPSSAILAGAAGLVVVWAAGGTSALRREPVRIAIAGAALLGAVSAPGILAAVVLLVLGYARRERGLIGLGVLALVHFLVAYYYDLELDLRMKSAVLGASGLTLLGAREVLRRRPWARKEAA